jgi:nitroreductase
VQYNKLLPINKPEAAEEFVMNEVLRAIESRRSVRRYKPDQIKDEDMEAIIRAGLYAPSAKNQQSWHFTVIQSKEVIDKLAADVKRTLAASPEDWVNAYAKSDAFHVFYEAPSIVIVSMERGKVSPLADCSAAIQNMLLAAESLGLGSCWIGLVGFHLADGSHNAEFGIPDSYEARYAVTLGYSAAENPKAPPRRTGTVNYL